MKRLSTAILAVGIALVFVLYMVTYTVGYNQTAIITTFDKATEATSDTGDSGSVMREPGLKFKWPWPIQRVQTYPTQLQVLQDTPEQLQLKDGNTIIINMALTWRIDDPLEFFKSLGTIEEAEDKLRAQMRDLRSVISSDYAFDDLVNESRDRVKLEALEDAVADKLRQQLKAIQPSYGIEVAEVTIGKMLYTESTAESVNTRMTATQERKAQEIRSQGSSQAEAIVSEANSISDQLRNFADTVATQIEIVGINEANRYIKQYADDDGSPDLAIYLRQLEAIEKILANRTTFVLDARTFSPLDVLVYGHGGEGNLSRLYNAEPDDADDTDRAVRADDVPAVLSLEQRNAILEQKVIALQERIRKLVEELDVYEQQQRLTETSAPLKPAEVRP